MKLQYSTATVTNSTTLRENKEVSEVVFCGINF